MLLQCPYCGFIWRPRVEKPRACVCCKRYYTEDYQPEIVSDSTQRFTKRQIKKGIIVLDESAQVICPCGEKAIFNVYGRNVCKQCVGTVLLQQSGPKRIERNDELDVIVRSAVEFANDLREATRKALIECKEKFPEQQVMLRVQQLWVQERM